jgi:hypothetical protein
MQWLFLGVLALFAAEEPNAQTLLRGLLNVDSELRRRGAVSEAEDWDAWQVATVYGKYDCPLTHVRGYNPALLTDLIAHATAR